MHGAFTRALHSHTCERTCALIQVSYFGTPTPLKQMGSITVPESTTLLIAPFDRTALRDIERAIQEADIGINPNNDGEKIRLIMPPMTQVGTRAAPGAGRSGIQGHAAPSKLTHCRRRALSGLGS